MKNAKYLMYLMSQNGGPTSYPEDTKYFASEQELREYEVFCKMKGWIYETYELFDVKDKNNLFPETLYG